MINTQTQIKINLPVNLKEYIESKAQKFGMPLAGYIKHLILKDVEDMDYPFFELSEKAERSLKEALENEDKATTITTKEELNKFFKNL